MDEFIFVEFGGSGTSGVDGFLQKPPPLLISAKFLGGGFEVLEFAYRIIRGIRGLHTLLRGGLGQGGEQSRIFRGECFFLLKSDAQIPKPHLPGDIHLQFGENIFHFAGAVVVAQIAHGVIPRALVAQAVEGDFDLMDLGFGLLLTADIFAGRLLSLQFKNQSGFLILEDARCDIKIIDFGIGNMVQDVPLDKTPNRRVFHLCLEAAPKILK
ncbi:MAG: hypothetical protein ACKOLA_01440 [Spartobacteria bacterium]